MASEEQLKALQQDVAKFWSEVLGDRGTPDYAVAKLLEEVKEFEKDPQSLEEAADCLLVILYWLKTKQCSLDDLVEASILKHQQNKERTWQLKANGLLQHKEGK